jgi:hypothetical protein
MHDRITATTATSKMVVAPSGGLPVWTGNKKVSYMIIIQQDCEKLQRFFCGTPPVGQAGVRAPGAAEISNSLAKAVQT